MNNLDVTSATPFIQWANQLVSAPAINEVIVAGVAIHVGLGTGTPAQTSPIVDETRWYPDSTGGLAGPFQLFEFIDAKDNNSSPSNCRVEMSILRNPIVGSGTVQVRIKRNDNGPAVADVIGFSISASGVDTTSKSTAIAASSFPFSNDSLVDAVLTKQASTRLCVGMAAVVQDSATPTPNKLHLAQTAGDTISEVEYVGTTTGTNTVSAYAATLRGQGTGLGAPFPELVADILNNANASTVGQWVAGFLALKPAVVSAVGLSSFDAAAYEGDGRTTHSGALLKWSTGYEADNLGFRLYRDDGHGGVQVTPDVIAGSALFSTENLSAGYSYVWWDPDGTPRSQYYLEDISINGFPTRHGPFGARRGVGTAPAFHGSALLSSVGAGTQAQSVTYLGDAFARAAQKGRSLASPTDVQYDLASKPTAKLGIRQAGWYRVTQPQIAALDIDTAAIDPHNLQLFAEGVEVPIKVTGEADGHFDASDAVEFYGTGVDTLSTDTRTYWLTVGTSAGARVRTGPGTPQIGAVLSFSSTVELKERLVYFAALANGDASNFFGRVLSSDPVDQVLTLQHVDSGGDNATVEIALQGVTEVGHALSVSFDGQPIGQISFNGKERPVQTFSVPVALLQEGANTVTLTPAGASGDVSIVDYVRVSYTHKASAAQNQLFMTTPILGRAALRIDGFSDVGIRVVDVTNPTDVVELTARNFRSGNGYSATVLPQSGSPRNLVAFTPDRVLSPASITLNVASQLHTSQNGADIVMIAPHDFIPSLAPLEALREGQGYTVNILDVEDIYDEFAFGAHTPNAVKTFLNVAATTWQTHPRFVVLAGDGSLDPRNYFGAGNFDFVPAKLVDTAYLEAASDDWFADFNGDHVPELAVGRLPVRTAQEAANVVGKIVYYESSGRGNRSALLVADYNDVDDFEAMTANIQALLPSDLLVTGVLRGQTDSATARQQILNGVNSGAGIVNYIGHGSVDLWRGGLLTADDAGSLVNSNHLSLFVMSNCLNGYYQDPFVEGLGEALVTSSSGGAVAVLASSGESSPISQSLLTQEFYRQLFTGSSTMGEAAMRAKVQLGGNFGYTWVFLGDPVTRYQ